MKTINNTAEIEFILGEHIKRIRLLKNIKREDLAAQAGISLTAIKNLESGQGATIKTFIKVLRVLDKVDWLFTLAPAVTVNPLKMVQSKGQRQRARSTNEHKNNG